MLGLTLLGSVMTLVFWATDNAVVAEVQHSRTVADMADSFRAVAAKHGGFYVRAEGSDDAKVGRYLASFVSAKSPEGKDYTFFQKNPFLAIGDYSSAVQASPAAAKFRITSDNYFNSANKPDEFDAKALRLLRQSSGVTETWSVENGQLRYARALKADKSCMTCHGSPEAAPPVVRAKYEAPVNKTVGGGYGYAEGSIVGVTSVTVPHLTPLQMLAHQNAGFWLSAGLVIGLMLTSYLFIARTIVAPLQKITRFSRDIVEVDDLASVTCERFDSDEAASRNEIHQAAFSLRVLHEAVQSAMQLIDDLSAKRRSYEQPRTPGASFQAGNESKLP
jgi:hypothetical protein